MSTADHPGTLASSAGPLTDDFDLVLLDLDGVVYLGPQAVPGAAETIGAVRLGGRRVGYVTNNSSRPPTSVTDQLTALGIEAEPADVMSSALAATRLLSQRLAPQSKVMVVGGDGLRQAVRDAGFLMVDSATESPDAVVQGMSPHLGWSDLAEAAYAISAGATWVATNVDLTLPTDRGLAPGNGAMVGAVAAATGFTPVSAGKPEPELFHQAIAAFGGGRAIMVGDRLDTDLAGARAAGIAGLLVLTGVSTVDDLVLAVPSERPDFVARNLTGLLAVHPAPVRTDTGWTCGDAWARVEEGVLRTSSSPLTIDGVRAATAAAWSAADAGEHVELATSLVLSDG